MRRNLLAVTATLALMLALVPPGHAQELAQDAPQDAAQESAQDSGQGAAGAAPAPVEAQPAPSEAPAPAAPPAAEEPPVAEEPPASAEQPAAEPAPDAESGPEQEADATKDRLVTAFTDSLKLWTNQIKALEQAIADGATTDEELRAIPEFLETLREAIREQKASSNPSSKTCGNVWPSWAPRRRRMGPRRAPRLPRSESA
ncbi:hypothetical protein AUC69_14115 [Methyloceanibacter superfactus]|uniref:Uncharacterized protein n=1 Tax=Methyloceanibacter superfactus TaxID=1774969 RepID=A0A1E3VT75_9HYPH|nr:hypothetical protein AUC69_14115 [Methyloceanibacter superfactus]